MIPKMFLLILLCFHVANSRKVKHISLLEKTPSFWIDNGRNRIDLKLKEIPMKSVAKNIILTIGDGMGISTVTSTRIYKNQQMVDSKLPDENLFFENFPNVGLSKTYSVNRYVADSAATATALLTGIKTNSGVLGLSAEIRFQNCTNYSHKNNDLINIAEMFYRSGKSVGFVTTAEIVDATPAAMYASTPSRTWKSEVKKGCLVKDIASQFIEKSEKFQVVLGGGRKYFLPKTEKDPEYPAKKGGRKDGRNLLNEWKRKMEKRQKSAFIYNLTQFQQLDVSNIDYLFGLFEYENIHYYDEQSDDPTLVQMTEMAIKILSKNPKGYFLLVEGGKIDKAHHRNQALRAILETLELEKAVQLAYKMSNPKETLMVVTADHSHTLTVGGYEFRETDITGKNEGFVGPALDKKGHTSLLYGNGPGSKIPRENITSETKFTPESTYQAGVPLHKASHAGEEVSVYAKGPWGHLLKDSYEQSYIGNVMMYASCNGVYQDRIGCSKSAFLFIQQPVILATLILNYYFVLM